MTAAPAYKVGAAVSHRVAERFFSIDTFSSRFQIDIIMIIYSHKSKFIGEDEGFSCGNSEHPLAINGILTNPIYMIGDETAYRYPEENHVDMFTHMKVR